jgi:hypothetical protein
VQQWRQQFQKLESVSLRYENQVIVNPDLEKPNLEKPNPVKLSVVKSSIVKPGTLKESIVQPSIAKAAAGQKAAGVKPAALTTPMNPHDRTLPKPAFELTEKKLNPKSADAKKPVTTKVSKKKGHGAST